MAGLLAVSMLPAEAAATPAEEIDPGMAQVVATAEVSSDPFDFESDSDAGKLEQKAQSFRAGPACQGEAAVLPPSSVSFSSPRAAPWAKWMRLVSKSACTRLKPAI